MMARWSLMTLAVQAYLDTYLFLLGFCCTPSHTVLRACKSYSRKPTVLTKMATQTETFQLSFPLPRSLDTRIFIQLTVQAKSVIIFLTTAAADETANPPPMGSFVYALPDVSL